MAETKIEYLFKNAYGYELKAIIEEWDSTTSAWVIVDISGFTTTDFKIKKPDDSIVLLSASFDTDGTDGVLVFTLPLDSTLFDQVGFYDWQAILANGNQFFPTAIRGFKVDDDL